MTLKSKSERKPRALPKIYRVFVLLQANGYDANQADKLVKLLAEAKLI